MSLYFKKALLPFLYLIFMMVLSYTVYAVDDSLIWLRIVFSIAVFLLYGLIVCGISYKDGQQALKTRLSNDVERRYIIETGEDRPLKTNEEYKFYKGFIHGLIECIPLMILMIIHTILIPSSDGISTGAGIVAGALYSIVFSFFSVINVQLTVYTYYYTLLAIPVIACFTGIPYILGAKSVESQQREIKEKHKQIYGE